LVFFGAFLTPKLQDFTANFINVGLDVLGIPYQSNGYIIAIPEGRFFVAEACAGLRFLIASIAFGALYSCLIYRSYLRRALFMLASIIIPIIANGFRALGIVVLGHLLGSAQAAAADHILYGWIFFSIVILLLILAGLPFRQDIAAAAAETPQPVAPPAPAQRRLVIAAACTALLAMVGPAASVWLDRVAQMAMAAPAPAFTPVSGCRQVATEPTAPGVTVQQLACAAGRLTVTVQAFPPRSNPAAVIGAERQASGELMGGDETIYASLSVPGVQPDNWRVVFVPGSPRVTAQALWIDGKPAVGGLSGRFTMARNSLLGSPYAPMLVTIAMQFPHAQLTDNELQQSQLLMRAFLTAQAKFSDQMTQLAMAAAR